MILTRSSAAYGFRYPRLELHLESPQDDLQKRRNSRQEDQLLKLAVLLD